MRRPRGYARRIRHTDLLEGLIVQPTDLSPDEFGSIMREGRKRMIERHGAAAIEESLRLAKEHISRTNQGARV